MRISRVMFGLGVTLVTLGVLAFAAMLGIVGWQIVTHWELTGLAVSALVGFGTVGLPVLFLGGFLAWSFHRPDEDFEVEPWAQNPWPE